MKLPVKEQFKENGHLIRIAKQLSNFVHSDTAFQYPLDKYSGRGIVMCAGGYSYFTNAWIAIRMLRHIGCSLPIQVWHFGAEEIDKKMKNLLNGLDVEFVDATPLQISKKERGWVLKSLAILKSRFEEVFYLDADNITVKNPEFLFESSEYTDTGAIFWPNVERVDPKHPIWKAFGISFIDGPSVETGQLLVNKRLVWRGLVLLERLNLHSDVFYRFTYGGKDLFRMAWYKTGARFAMPKCPPQILTIPDPNGEATDAVLCQNDFSGERLFQHRVLCKWDLLGHNPWVTGCFFEGKCHEFLEELRSRWTGRPGRRVKISDSALLKRCKEALVSGPWFLLYPKEPNNGFSTLGLNMELQNSQEHWTSLVKAPQDVGEMNFRGKDIKKAVVAGTFKSQKRSRMWKELSFARNGTLKKGANPHTGYFWDVRGGSNGPHLLLSSNGHPQFKLTRVSDSLWKGNGVVLKSLQGRYPHLSAPTGGTDGIRRDVLRKFGRKVHITCSRDRVGDHIATAQACVGLSRLGIQVVFHSIHADWLSSISEPHLKVTKKHRKVSLDVNYDYENQLRFGKSKAAWYASAIHPKLQPAMPNAKKDAVRRFPFERYILMAPYTTHPWELDNDRNWPLVHWTRLANLLRDKGFEIVAIGSQGQQAALLRTFSQTQTYWTAGQSPDWIADALLCSAVYIGVDNDTTHLATLLGVKTIAIHSQLPASFLWPSADVCSVTPDSACTFCRWQEERGYHGACVGGCSSLATVGPQSIVEIVQRMSTPGERCPM